jgi:arsenite methyltransferase
VGQDIRGYVSVRYAQVARVSRSSGGPVTEPCCADGCGCGPTGYVPEDLATVPVEAADISLGCGNPVAVADLRPGEVVLDLGAGGGLDVLLAAGRVGPTGKVYGLDMTGEMIALARENQQRAGVENAEFLEGFMESIPLPADTLDVVLSNCVVNLSPDKAAVFGEMFRVLKPGGRVAIYDVVADRTVHADERADREAWAACLTGAISRGEYRRGLEAAGLQEVAIDQSHEVASGFSSVVVRALKPPDEGAEPPTEGS